MCMTKQCGSAHPQENVFSDVTPNILNCVNYNTSVLRINQVADVEAGDAATIQEDKRILCDLQGPAWDQRRRKI